MRRASRSAVIPWKLRIAISVISAVTSLARKCNGTVSRRLLKFLGFASRFVIEPVDGVKTSDITVDPVRNLWFRLFTPTDVSDAAILPVIVFFHGGGFSFYSADYPAYDTLCRRFARKTPAVVVSVNYRLSPEHRHPSPYDDGFDTLRFLDQRELAELPKNTDISRCFLAGDSAGGNIAHFVARRFVESESEFPRLRVIGLLAIQPFFGGEERTKSEIQFAGAPLVSLDLTNRYWNNFLPEGSNRDHEACNVFGPNSADFSRFKNFPASFVAMGELDPLQDWHRRYCEGLKRSGTEVRLFVYPNAFHGFYVFPALPDTSLFFREAVNFIQEHSQLQLCRWGNFNGKKMTR